jgi:hypothetical protein
VLHALVDARIVDPVCLLAKMESGLPDPGKACVFEGVPTKLSPDRQAEVGGPLRPPQGVSLAGVACAGRCADRGSRLPPRQNGIGTPGPGKACVFEGVPTKWSLDRQADVGGHFGHLRVSN